MHVTLCICTEIPNLDLSTRLALVMHTREVNKPTATGPLAMEALTKSKLFVHGRRESPLDLHHLHQEGRRVLVLYPSEDARQLNQDFLLEDSRPITLVVPDGNWRQASRIPNRVPGLEKAVRVVLPDGPSSRWHIRTEPRSGGLATFEAIARALGIIESESVQLKLEQLFDTMVSATLKTRQGSHEKISNFSTENNLPILYQDEHLVAINKPSGLLVHKGWARDGIPALQQLGDQLGAYLFPVHRLDRSTSGVLIFAFSSEVAQKLCHQFESRTIAKRYLALCRGHKADIQTIDHPLPKVVRRKQDQKIEERSQRSDAVTDLRLLGQFERYGLYEVRPKTGRTHQIRRHFKHISQPIIGDVRYGKGEHNRIFRDRFGFQRLALHCSSMSITHPMLEETLVLKAPIPRDFSELLMTLGLNGKIPH